MEQLPNPDEQVTIVTKPTTIKELAYESKLRFYAFLSTTAINLYTLEGIVLSTLVTLYPNHAQEIVYYFATYLGFKQTK